MSSTCIHITSYPLFTAIIKYYTGYITFRAITVLVGYSIFRFASRGIAI